MANGEAAAQCPPGPGAWVASRWAADRVRDSPAFAAAFDAVAAAKEGRPVMFTGECVYRWVGAVWVGEAGCKWVL